jgi:diguanylate cyclase (GGDEF)-like protein
VRVLLAEDDPILRRLLESFLVKWGYEVTLANDGAEAWAILQAEDSPRLALLDWMMPGMDGVEVCHEVRKRVAQPYVYMLLLTAKNDNLDVINGLASGADDYLTKPFNPEELQARLRTGKRILDLEDHLVAAREAMYFKATHDALTGLWNRAAILDNLNRELIRARRQTAPMGILLLDLDRFKSINDAYGHFVGDDVLKEAARRMLASVRVYDSVGRYGGEEFLIVLPGCDESSTREKAEQLRKTLEGRVVETSEGSLHVTLSIGALSTDVWRDGDADTLLRAADAALYRAKDAGRNRIEMAVPGKAVLIPCMMEEARLASQSKEH